MGLVFWLIDLPCLYLVGYILFWVLFPVIPFDHQILFRRMDPEGFFIPLWGSMYTVSHYVAAAVAVVWLIIWIVYNIIRAVFPWPIKKPLLRIPIFRVPAKRGLFRLFDALADLIPKVSQGQALEGLRQIAEAIVLFLEPPVLKIVQGIEPKEVPEEDNMTEKDREEERKRRTKSASDSDAWIEDHHVRCMEELVAAAPGGKSARERGEDYLYCRKQILEGVTLAMTSG